jgi:conjugal transfer pilus assembly protein TraK
MRKIISITLLSVLITPVFADNSANQIHFNDNSSTAIQASVNNINRIFVPDDKIVQHVAPQGTFAFDKVLSKDGSLYFKPLFGDHQFTIFFTTEKGHHFSVLVSGVSENGKTIEMIPNNTSKAEVRWEKNQGYLKLLQSFMKNMINDKTAKGVQSIEVKDQKAFKGYPNTEMILKKVYQGGQIQGFVYQIMNVTDKDIHLEERKFWREGVRAISLSEHVLKPHHSGFVYTILGDDNETTH